MIPELIAQPLIFTRLYPFRKTCNQLSKNFSGEGQKRRRKEGSLMSKQENMEIGKESYAAFQWGDIQAVLKLYTDDAELIQAISTALFP
jgi:hypothetical protein